MNISVLPKPTRVIVDASTLRLSWTLQNSSTLQDQIFSSVWRYVIELTGGNCPSNGSIIRELEVSQHNHKETLLLSGLQIELNSGASYLLRMKALGYYTNFTSNFSEPAHFTTMPEGIIIIMCM